MSEIKHQFTGGKMNKDADERLVPNGEYRQAINVQVSTSEGSDVGTVQNVLGNVQGCNAAIMSDLLPSGSSFTVGAIADEKNDTLYWLVSGQPYLLSSALNYINNWSNFTTMTDVIIRKRPSTTFGEADICEPVFVDQYAFTIPNTIYSPTSTLSGLPQNLMNQIGLGWSVAAVNSIGDISNTVDVLQVNFAPPIPSIPSNIILGTRFYTDLHGFLPLVGSSGPPSYAMPNNNVLYIEGYSSNITGFATYNNSTVELFSPGHPDYQQNTIVSATFVSVTMNYHAPGLNYIVNLIKLEMLSPVTLLTTPSATAANTSTGFLGTGYAGGNIYGSIGVAVLGGVQVPVPYNVVNTDISDFDVTLTGNLTPGDPVAVGNVNGCVGVVGFPFSYSNAFTVVDCVSGAPLQINNQITSFSFPDQATVSLSDDIDFFNYATTLLFSKPKVLNFNHEEYITGINIIDDMLFWTDGKTEPKKINIPRSVEGTDASGLLHTRLINQARFIDITSDILVKEEHITVIRKAPLKAPFLEMKTSLRSGIIGVDEELTATTSAGAFDNVGVGQEVNFTVDDIVNEAPNFKKNDLLVLAISFGDLPDNGELRVKITNIDTSVVGETTYTVQVQSTTSSGFLSGASEYFVQLYPANDLFKLKLPRFAYRYKYEDNEYSSFSPFSEVAFIPSAFNYEPIKAYNEGMVNNIKSLSIQNFVPTTMPLDVVQVDILYKNETSPTIYLLQSVSPLDPPVEGQLLNNWHSQGSRYGLSYGPGADKGSLKISSENVSRALDSSQSLRVYDNVPKTAKAQEVTGSRIVYGNYNIGYESIQPQITATLSGRPTSGDTFEGKKSLKSLRDYDIGVVWGDKYGRETPVKTAGSSISVPKSQASNSSYLSVALDESPAWADYYRFYIKETSNEYYNLAMDRIYDAGDGNVWVSFPSIDRNKIDEDTYIVLKKGTDADDLVMEKARYKVVAIENEAPEYIKTSFEKILRTNQDTSRPPNSCNMYGGTHDNFPACDFIPGRNAPVPGRKGFSLHADLWSDLDYSDVSPIGQQLTAPKILLTEVTGNANKSGGDELYVSWSREVTNTLGVLEETISQKYKVANAERVNGISVTDIHYVSLSKAILQEDLWISSINEYGLFGGGWNMHTDDVHVHFWKKTVQNKPEFDGRFFVKILNDKPAQDNLVGVGLVADSYLRVRNAIDIYKVEDTKMTDLAHENYSFTNAGNYNPSAPSTGSTTSTQSQWKQILKFGKTSIQQRWFIDGASFASQQGGTVPSSGTLSYSSVNPYFTNSAGNTRRSYDISSTRSINYDAECIYNTTEQAYRNENIGDGKSNNSVGMKGVHTYGGQEFIDISYSAVSPDGPSVADTKGTSTSLNWNIGSLGNSYNSSANDVIVSLKIGERFRFNGSDAVYKILGVNKFKLFNYQGNNTSSKYVEYAYPGYNYSKAQAKAFDAACGKFWSNEWPSQVSRMQELENRRFTYRIKYEIDQQFTPLTSLGTNIKSVGEPYNNLENLANPGSFANSVSTVTIEFLSPFTEDGKNTISTNPAIFETEPKEDVDIDIYYEASASIPTFPLNNINKYLYIPLGSLLLDPAGGVLPPGNGQTQFTEAGMFVAGWSLINPNNPVYQIDFSGGMSESTFNSLLSQTSVYAEKDNGQLVQFKIISGILGGTYTISTTFGSLTYQLYSGCIIEPKEEVGLSWFNCWSFKNGVESNRIGDTYNKPYVTNGVTASASTQDLNEKENREYGLIYSGLYNSTSSVNNLNQFIAAEKITKDINPIYGSIQKLYSGWGQGGDLVALCEDRVLKILANKDALFNADGNSNITSTNNVLGTATPYTGEFGISKNPESFASDAYRIYFTDKVRGSVMRLSRDGLTAISNHGMKDWFRDNLRLTTKIIGSFDDKKDEYNLTLFKPSLIPIATQLLNPSVVYDGNATVTFKEDVRGWVSFKTFTPENAISCANQYYSFKGGTLWQHNAQQFVSGKEIGRNTFYNVYKKSELTVVFNEAPGSVKSFRTLNYEGSQARVFQNLYTTTGIGGNISYHTADDGQYYNLEGQPGWYVSTSSEDEAIIAAAETNLEKGSVSEFIEKEGKWFSYFAGKDVNINENGTVVGGFNSAAFSVQGIGKVASVIIAPINGCTNPLSYNYMASANVDDGSCYAVVPGCTGVGADNYDATANTDDGSCYVMGCTDATAFNYNALATILDASCIAVALGCINPVAFNYNASANTSDGTCTAVISGCTDLTATNHDPLANTDDGSCIAVVLGCTDINAYNNDPLANTDDGSCITVVLGCTDPLADSGYDSLANTDDGSCFYIVLGCIDSSADNYLYNAAGASVPSANTDDGSCIYTVLGCTDSTACNYDSTATVDDGNCAYCGDPTAVDFDGVIPGCVSGCTYCYPVANFVFSNLAQTSFTVEFEEPNILQDSVAIGYSIYLNGILYAYATQAHPDLTGWQSNPSLLTFTVTGLTANTSYTIGIQRDCGGNNFTATQTNITTLPVPVVNGCTDPTANNYDASANTDDGSCTYDINGCMDPNACNYDPSVTVDDGSCEFTSCFGCTVPGNVGYDAIYTIDNGCAPCVYGCTVPGNTAFDANATCDDGTCDIASYGCTDSTASNYNPAWGLPDDGSCIWFGCMDSGTNSSLYQNNTGTPGSLYPGFPADNYDTIHTVEDNSCTYIDTAILASGLSIGDNYKGGIIFHLDGFGGGLVVAADVIADKPWGCSNQYNGSSGVATLQAFGTGSANTADIMQYCVDPTGTAAEAVDDSIEGGYSDWFLPSKEELIVMRANVGKGASGTLHNIAELNGTHWTSSEAPYMNTNAYFQNMNSGNSAPGGAKVDLAKVRAIRSF